MKKSISWMAAFGILAASIAPSVASAEVTCKVQAEMEFRVLKQVGGIWLVDQNLHSESQTHELYAENSADCVARAWEFVSDYKEHQSTTGEDAFFRSGSLQAGKTNYKIERKMYHDGVNSRIKISR